MTFITQHTIDCASHVGKECDCPMGMSFMNAQDIRVQLSLYITTAFKHEAEFLEKFCSKLSAEDLLEVYMADTRTKIEIMVPSGTHVTTTISTTKFINWCNDMNNSSLDGIVIA